MKIVELSGGVGGSRMARALAMLDADLSVVVNIGDDETVHGLHVSPDLDTVIYTLAGVEGPAGWGRAKDTFRFNEELARFGLDNRFRLGDLDVALKLYRTLRMAEGASLATVAGELCGAFEVATTVLPASDDPVRTEVKVEDGDWISFQEYFVLRQYQDEVEDIRFSGSESAHPAPGVLAAVNGADIVVIAPSNPPLSIWPILAIPGLRPAVAAHPNVVCVSPLIGGKTVKGPADRVLSSLGLGSGNRAVAQAYEGLIDTFVIDQSDSQDIETISGPDVILAATLMKDSSAALELARIVTGL